MNTRALLLGICLALAVVLSGCSQPPSPAAAPAAPAATPAPPAPAGGTQVTMNHNTINPAQVAVKAGESVTWTNQVSMDHTPTGEGWKCDLSGKNTCTQKFDKPGTYPYKQSGHDATGTVTVT
ncbi:MAG: amidase [Euryarchaeota archaeon]|nr:amidase [Euryarchaeota archaeon]